MTTGKITDIAIEELTLRGFECWRQNNLAVRGRKFRGKKGLGDVIGFQTKPATGILLLCEVKNEGDTLSNDQIKLLDLAKGSGAFCFIATVNKQGKFIMNPY